MPDNRALDFKSVRIDGLLFRNREYTVLENFPGGDDFHISTVANAVSKLSRWIECCARDYSRVSGLSISASRAWRTSFPSYRILYISSVIGSFTPHFSPKSRAAR